MVIRSKDIDARMAEEQLLACLLYKPDKIVEVIDEVNPSIFSVAEFGKIYKCIVELYKDNVIPDEVMVMNKALALGYEIAPELVKKLSNCKTFVAKRQLKQYCNVIKTSAFKRKTLDLCTDFVERAKDMSNPEDILSEFSNLTIDMSDKLKAKNNLSRVEIDTKAYTDNILHKLEHPDELNGIPFGFPTMDAQTDGACPGEIISLSGLNGGCKTYVALTMMKNMAKYLLKNKINKYILFFSLEMTKEQLNNRLISMESGISSTHLKKPKLYFLDKNIPMTQENVTKFITKIAKATKVINSLPILIDDSSCLSAGHIALTVKKEELKHGLACVFIDHVAKVESESGQEEWQTISNAYKIWTRTAKDTKIPFIVLIQYLKQLKDQKLFRGTMQDLSGSKTPMNESHKIFHTYKADLFSSVIEKHPEWINKVAILNDKNRDLPLMKDLWLAWDGGELKEVTEIEAKNKDLAEMFVQSVKDGDIK